MSRGTGAACCREGRSAEIRQLVRVRPQRQAEALRSLEKARGLLAREAHLVELHVEGIDQALSRDRGQYLPA